jgi:hypothetical protein
MAYTINKTDGSILATVADGQVDEIKTDLTLIGKNYSGFGEALNENFVKLLENFAGTAVPTKPIRGQVWFDTNELKLKVYNGTAFQPVSSATISEIQPTDLAIGDLWFDNTNKQLFFYDGVSLILLGPDYSKSQGLSNLRVSSILDDRNQTRIISSLYINGVLLGIFSKDQFFPKVEISGYGTGEIVPGFNQSPTSGIKFVVTSTNSEKLGNQPATSYVRSDTSGEIDGTLSITGALLVGDANQSQLVVQSGNIKLANIANNKNLTLTVRRNDVSQDAIVINASSQTVQLYPNELASTVEVGGNLNVVGNFTVNGSVIINDGSLTTVKTSQLLVEDKLIILGETGDSSYNDDDYANGGGIILKGNNDKEFVWVYNSAVPGVEANDAWNSSEHINLTGGKEFKINGVTVISSTSLGTGITSAPGLTNFGPQVFVQIGPSVATPILRLQENRLASVATNSNIEITPNGTGNIVLKRVTGATYSTQTDVGFPLITGLATTNQSAPSQTTETTGTKPASPTLSATELSESTNKKYVLNLVRTRSLAFSLDTSDGVTNTGIENILSVLAPVNEYEESTIARILCTTLTNAASTADVEAGKIISTSLFLDSLAPSSAPAVTNVAFGSITVPAPVVQVSPRVVKQFQIVSGVWTYITEAFV